MNLDNPFYLCSDCSKDIYLKNYIQQHSKSKNSCTICQQDKLTIDISSDSLLRTFCRFLIRFHFPEYEYNTHWGGVDLPKTFYHENPIISEKFSNVELRDGEIDEFLNELFDLGNSKSQIELYYGRDITGRGLFPEAIKNEKSDSWKRYKSQLIERNFFLLESEAKSTFVKLLDDLKYELKSGNSYFRARIGYKEREEEIGVSKVMIKISFSDNELSSPPILKAKAGRANRQGVSFLYLASDEETAVGEIRPHPGHYVSSGEFFANIDLHIADFRFIDLVKYFRDENKLQMFKLLKDLSNELSVPILPEEQGNYLVTQFISDIIRQLGFDGIMFNSSVSSGHNLVVFNSENFSFKTGSSKLVKITSLKFNLKPIEYQKDFFLERAIEN